MERVRTSPICPKCDSQDVGYIEKRQRYICPDCNHQWSAIEKSKKKSGKPEPFNPLKIFLSYGHDEHANEVLRIKSELEKRGHEVWFDLERIISGKNFDSYIEEGLKWCDKAVLAVTPYSVRRRNSQDPESSDGFCLNEIAKMLELNKLVIPIMLVRVDEGLPVSICRIQYLDMTDCIPIEQKWKQYKIRFNRLTEAIEHDALDFEGGQARLIKNLQPLKFDAEISRYITRFFGREWLFSKLDEWMYSQKESRVFWLVGGVGTGKSAISSHLCNFMYGVDAIHLCSYGHDDKSNPRRAILSIAYQLSQHIHEYERKLQHLHLEKDVLMNAKTLFQKVIAEPLSEIPPPDNIRLVVIDAIDEATVNGGNEIAEIVWKYWLETPEWLKLFVTSRPESEVVVWLQNMKGLNKFRIEAYSKENIEDLHGFVVRELKRLGYDPEESIINTIVEKSEGHFLYIIVVMDDIGQNHLSLNNIKDFPRGLTGYYQNYFERQFPDKKAYEEQLSPVLNAIIAAREPLPIELLRETPRKLFNKLGSLFPIQKHPDQQGIETVVPFHKSVRDWLTETDPDTGYLIAGDFALDIATGNKILADACWKEYLTGSRNISTYVLKHLPTHLRYNKRWDKLEEVLTDLRYIEAKCAAGMVDELIRDYRTSLEMLPEAQKDILKADERNNRLKKYVEGLVAYAGKQTVSPSSYAAELYPNVYSLPTPALLPDPPESIRLRLWADKEKTKADNERIIDNLTRLDKFRAFSLFVNAEAHNLIKYGKHPGFCVQQAYNFADSGPVATAAEDLVNPDNENLLLLRSPSQRPRYNLNPALLKTLEGRSGRVEGVSISFDGKTAISGGADKSLRVWDVKSGKCLRTLPGHTDSILSVSITPNARIAVSGSEDKTLRIWEIETGKCLKILEGHTDSVESVSITADGKTVVSGAGNKDRTLRLWNIENGKCLKMFVGHTDSVLSVSITPNVKTAVSGCADRTLRVWDVEGGKCLRTLVGHKNSVYSVSITPNGKTAVSGSWDKTLRIWDIESGKCVKTLEGHNSLFKSISITPDGKIVVSGSMSGKLHVWDVKSGKCFRTLEGHKNSVCSISMTPDGKTAISGGKDKTLRIWDIEGKNLKTLESHINSTESVSIAPDGKTAVSGSEDKTLRIWDIETGKCLKILEGHTDSVESVSITSDSRTIVSGSEDNTLRIWDIETGKCLNVLEGHTHSAKSVNITLDGKTAVSGSMDNSLRVWDIESGKCLSILKGHTHWVNSVRIAPDGKTAVSGSEDSTLRVWNIVSGKCLKIFENHTDSINSVSITPDGKTAVSGSEDSTLRVWDIVSGKCLKIFENHTGSVNSISITPDGKTAASGSMDNSLCVWDIESGDCLAVYPGRRVKSISQIRADQSFAYTTASGEVVFLKPRNFPMAVPIVTPVLIWRYLDDGSCGQWDDRITSLCQWCGRRFPVANKMPDMITAINRNSNISQDQSPCLKLPAEAWNEPGLLSECPKCGKPLRFNPFIVDNGNMRW